MAPTALECKTLPVLPSTIQSDDFNDTFPISEKSNQQLPQEQTPPAKIYKWNIVWLNVIVYGSLHIAGLYGLYLSLSLKVKILTTIFSIVYGVFSGIGITMGAHRLWAHKSFKAKLPLKIILTISQTTAFQSHLFAWVRDHRVHHKFSETDADPFNVNRGIFYCHIGWHFLRRSKEICQKGATVDMSDLINDPLVMFQKKTYWYFSMPLLAFIIPTLIPYYAWDESLLISFLVCGALRWIIVSHSTWMINSVAHMVGNKPYEKSIGATDNRWVSFLALGEGWHNYHHVFPWDYKTSELPVTNVTKTVIDLCSKIGWAYDMKVVAKDVIIKRMNRTGDGSHPLSLENHSHEGQFWGWGDKDMTEKDKCAIILNPEKIEKTI